MHIVAKSVYNCQRTLMMKKKKKIRREIADASVKKHIMDIYNCNAIRDKNVLREYEENPWKIANNSNIG